jgi:ATP-dependent Clp protease ATP-binding subunit ClpB
LDRALVVAAQLSSRYITGRFLPDKAIDLIDEACANVRVQLDSQPEEIDALERKKVQLEVELHALEKDKDKASKARSVEVSPNQKLGMFSYLLALPGLQLEGLSFPTSVEV